MYFYLNAHVLVAKTGQFDEREEADELLVELLEFRVAAEDEGGHLLVLTLHFDDVDLATKNKQQLISIKLIYIEFKKLKKNIYIYNLKKNLR